MLKKVLIILLAIVLLVSPLVIRWFYFYAGWYQPGEVVHPDLSEIEEPLPEPQPFTDQHAAAVVGSVLVDLAHDNHIQMAELNVLQARLAARGLRLEPVTEPDDLAGKLRYAQALAIISPGQDWTPDEIRLVQEFVAKGGRLLLVTDPTRYGVLYDEWDQYVGLDYDASHINDLATRFGVVFQADYLYNTVDNEGNFRNIKLTDLTDHPLTQGLQQLVFNATHSIVSAEPALITAGGATRSSTSEQVEGLVVGVLAADGAVLALGDLTFMTEPTNAVYDNDRFIANIADFLSSAPRRYKLSDFPFFFADQADLVYLGGPLLDGALLEGGSSLQALFAEQGKTLTVRAAEDESRDTLFFGLYEQADEVEPYLAAAQVTVVLTSAQTLEEEGTTPKPTPPPAVSPSSASSQPPAMSLPITPTAKVTATPIPPTGPESPPSDKDRITIGTLGEMALPGTSLLLLQTEGEREVMVVLAHTEKGLDNALERLMKGDLANCLLDQVETPVASLLALCPTGETIEEEEPSSRQEPAPAQPTPTPAPAVPSPAQVPEAPTQPEGGILILSLDTGNGRYDSMTSVDDYAAILEGQYEITIWSTEQDGPVELQDLLGYDLVIWTLGDYEDAMSQEYTDLLLSLMSEGTPAIVSGAYASDATTEAVQRDVQVKDASHPLAAGFTADQVIEFVAPPSGQEYEVGVLEFGEGEGSIVFVRGPKSEANGTPSIVALGDEVGEFQLVFIGFPLYLLPEAPKSQLVLNAVSWLLGP